MSIPTYDEWIKELLCEINNKEVEHVPWDFERLQNDPARHKKDSEVKYVPGRLLRTINFPKGMRIRGNEDTVEHEFCKQQSGGGKGTVIKDAEGIDWVNVMWDNGHINSYPQHYLIPIDEDFVDVDSLSINEKRYPYFVGTCVKTTVITDPALPKEREGYIVSQEMRDDRIPRFMNYNETSRNNIYLRIQFEDGNEVILYYNQIEKINKPCKDVEKIKLSDDSCFYVIEGIKNKKQKDMEERIIVQGKQIVERKVFDDVWREKMKKMCDNC